MKLRVLALAALVASVPLVARAQQRGSFFTVTWGPSGILGLRLGVACNALAGPAWEYRFENQTTKSLTFSYSFAGEEGSYSHTLPPHGRWTLHHVSRRFSCSSNGPLQVTASP